MTRWAIGRHHYRDGRTDHLIRFCQAIYALVDQLVSSRPWIVGHWWVCFPVPVLYVVFNVSYWAGGGTNEVSLNHGLINFIDTKAKCRFLKKLISSVLHKKDYNLSLFELGLF